MTRVCMATAVKALRINFVKSQRAFSQTKLKNKKPERRRRGLLSLEIVRNDALYSALIRLVYIVEMV